VITNERQVRGERVSEINLSRAVETILERQCGTPVNVSSVKRERSPFMTLSCAEVLTVTLVSGETVLMLLKHIDTDLSAHPDKQCREREIRVYEQLFHDASLPVAKYFGSRWSKTTHQYELFLEYVAGWNLKYHDICQWIAAARRLAHFHAQFARDSERLRAAPFLLHFDAAYVRDWVGRALAVTAARSGELAIRLESVVRRYGAAVNLLCEQLETLVHNDLSPKNVLADASREPVRICFVDWELAGVGCGVMDLVHLKYGLGREDDTAMQAAYYAEVAGTGLIPASRRDFDRLVAACELHKTLYRLARSQAWSVPIETVATWVTEAQRLASQV